jgi:hypothetical protein
MNEAPTSTSNMWETNTRLDISEKPVNILDAPARNIIRATAIEACM